jgi:hypothetical protein
MAKAPEMLFYGRVIFKYEQNDFELIYILCIFFTLSMLPRAIKTQFFPRSRSKDDDIFLMEIIFSFFFHTLRCCSSDYFFNLFIFNGRFSTFFFVRESHKREFIRCLSSLEFFLFSFFVH